MCLRTMVDEIIAMRDGKAIKKSSERAATFCKRKAMANTGDGSVFMKEHNLDGGNGLFEDELFISNEDL